MISIESILKYVYDMIILLGLNTCDHYATIYGRVEGKINGEVGISKNLLIWVMNEKRDTNV